MDEKLVYDIGPVDNPSPVETVRSGS